MKRCALAVVLAAAAVAAAAAQPAPAPRPGPEHQRLGAFVGNWRFEGEMKPGPMGPGGKLTGTDRIQWLPGNFFVERRFEGKTPAGAMSGIELIAYDAAKKTYTYNASMSDGLLATGTLRVSGSTWTTEGTASLAGTVFHERCTLAFAAGNTSIAVKCEMSADGKQWAPSLEGTATKAK